MRMWLVGIGVLGALAVIILVLAGVDVPRLVRTGPPWRRALIAAGLALIGATGVAGCDRSSPPSCYRASVPVTCYAPAVQATQPTSQPTTQPPTTRPAASQPMQTPPTCYSPAPRQRSRSDTVPSPASRGSQSSPLSPLQDRLQRMERLAGACAIQPGVLRAVLASLQSDLASMRDLTDAQRQTTVAMLRRVEQLADIQGGSAGDTLGESS